MERKDLAKIFHQTVGLAISKVRELEISKELKTKKPGDYFLENKPTYISQLAGAAPFQQPVDAYPDWNGPVSQLAVLVSSWEPVEAHSTWNRTTSQFAGIASF